jgi:cytochrome o ubiquinol oxidase operon protein cyoD
MEHELSLNEIQKEWHGTIKTYLIGFFGSLLLTGISFFLVIERVFSHQHLIYALVTLALIQGIVQLRFFLHLGEEAKPRWETLVCGFMVVVLLIIALGSLWIMHDLDVRVMSDMNMEMPSQ